MLKGILADQDKAGATADQGSQQRPSTAQRQHPAPERMSYAIHRIRHPPRRPLGRVFFFDRLDYFGVQPWWELGEQYASSPRHVCGNRVPRNSSRCGHHIERIVFEGEGCEGKGILAWSVCGWSWEGMTKTMFGIQMINKPFSLIHDHA